MVALVAIAAIAVAVTVLVVRWPSSPGSPGAGLGPRPASQLAATGTAPIDTAPIDSATGTAPIGTAEVDLAATVTAAGPASGIDRVPVTITITNRGSVPVVPTDVGVLGLGTALIDRSDLRTIPVGASSDLPVTLIADCAARLDPQVSVLVTLQQDNGRPGRTQGRLQTGLVQTGRVQTVRAATPPADQVVAVLDPVCPAVQHLLAVAITSARLTDDGSLTVRLVNHGRLSATVVALAAPDALPATLDLDPGLPIFLDPGEAVVATVRVSTPNCVVPDARLAADGLSLEARTPYGFTQVSGWPRELAQQVVQERSAACAIRLGSVP